MTASAPLGRLGADGVLHVLNALAIPLIVERREVMSRAEPLVIDVLVATFAGIRLHEELAGDFPVAVDLGRTGKKWTLRSITLLIHGGRRHLRILDARPVRPARLAHVAQPSTQAAQQGQADRQPHDCARISGMQPTASPCSFGNQKTERGRTYQNVAVHPLPHGAHVSGTHQPKANTSSDEKEEPASPT